MLDKAEPSAVNQKTTNSKFKLIILFVSTFTTLGILVFTSLSVIEQEKSLQQEWHDISTKQEPIRNSLYLLV